MPVMKYTPQFIERQYIPTQNIGLIDQVLGQRQKEYDTATAMQNAAMSELYGLQTTQGFEPERNKIIEGLQGQITQAAEKRGGDYGAAAQDIAQIISKAQANPFFQRNRMAMENADMLRKLKAQNPNIFVAGDPDKMAYRDDLTPDDLQYSVINPEDVKKLVAQKYSHFGDKRLSGMKVVGGYDVGTYTQGPDEQQIQEILSNPQALAEIKELLPQTRGMDSEELNQFLSSNVQQGLQAMRGNVEEKVLGANIHATLAAKAAYDKQENPDAYAHFVETSTRGIANPTNIKNAKSLFNTPNDDSPTSLTKKAIFQDILKGKFDGEGNQLNPLLKDPAAKKILIDEFGGDIDRFYNEYKNMTTGSVRESGLNHPAVKDYLANNPDYLSDINNPTQRQIALGQLYQNLITEGEISPNARQVEQSKYREYKNVYDKLENTLNTRLHELNSDFTKSFKYYDTMLPGTAGKAMDDRAKRMNEFVKNYVSVDDINFETSSNPDISFSGERKEKLLKDKNFQKIQQGEFDLTGLSVDPIMGVKATINAKNDDGGTTQHIISFKNPFTAYNLIARSGNQEWEQAFGTYHMAQQGQDLYNHILEREKTLAPIQGETINSYINRLESTGITTGKLNRSAIKSIEYFLASRGLAETDKF